MEKIYISDDKNSQQYRSHNAPKNAEDLKLRIAEADYFADVEVRSPKRAIVRVHHNMGSSQFLASGVTQLGWLSKYATKKEIKGSITLYYFSF